MKYWILFDDLEDDSAVIDDNTEDGPEDWEFFENEPLKDRFPENATLKFSDSNKTIKLYDFVTNTSSLLIVSDRVRGVLNDEGVEQVEYLPVSILDHRGDVAGENYFIINILNAQPIIDMERSKYKLNHFDKNKIASIQKLYLSPEDVDQNAKLFRAATKPNLYFITNDILGAFNAAGISNFRVIEAEGWDGNDLVL